MREKAKMSGAMVSTTCLFKIVARVLARHADAFAVLVQQDGDGHKYTGEKPKERACPADAEVIVHRSREEREACAEHGTDEVVSGENAGGIGGIGVCEIVQHNVL